MLLPLVIQSQLIGISSRYTKIWKIQRLAQTEFIMMNSRLKYYTTDVTIGLSKNLYVANYTFRDRTLRRYGILFSG